ncbi:MAG: hypothetical protein GX345_06420 [Clostridiales bacterium]|nr:hypothetical protein [Clostridiales bacterium]
MLLAFSLLSGIMLAGSFTGMAKDLESSSLIDEPLLNGRSNYPIVVVPGLGMSDVALFDDYGNQIENRGSEGEVWRVLNLIVDDVLEDVWKFIPSVLLTLIFQKDIGLSKIVSDYLPGMFRYAQHDLEGRSVENVRGLLRDYPLSDYDEQERDSFFRMMPMQAYTEEIGEDYIYAFNFPPFCNTYDQAENLHQFIQTVKAQTGAQKVNLVPVSLGATIANAYFDLYADKGDVAKVVKVVGASDGSYIFSDLVAQNLSVDSAEMFYTGFMPALIDGFGGYLVNVALRILPKKVLNQVLDAAFVAVRESIFINTPSMWSIVPADRYEEISEIYLSGDEYAIIKEQTDRYYAYQKDLEANTLALVESGVQVFNICGYGFNMGHGWHDYQYFQFFECADDLNSDGIIQLASTSLGAYSVAPGQTLPEDYVQQNTYCDNPQHNHISPDRVVDASTCYLPEHTWFFAGQHHECAGNDVIIRLAAKLMSGDSIKDVHSDPEFPQFNGSRNTKRIVRDYMPRCLSALERNDISASQRMDLEAVVRDCEAMLASNVADNEEALAIEARMRDILVKVGEIDPPKQDQAYEVILEDVSKGLSDFLWNKYGPTGFSEIARIEFDNFWPVAVSLIKMFKSLA